MKYGWVSSGILGLFTFAIVFCACSSGTTTSSVAPGPTAGTGTAGEGMPAPAHPTASASSSPSSEVAIPDANPEEGREAIQNYGCGNCHTIPGVAGANGQVGPSLANFAGRKDIAGVVPNTPEELIEWIMDPQAVKPRTQMPRLGVTESEARNMAAYLYTLR